MELTIKPENNKYRYELENRKNRRNRSRHTTRRLDRQAQAEHNERIKSDQSYRDVFKNIKELRKKEGRPPRGSH